MLNAITKASSFPSATDGPYVGVLSYQTIQNIEIGSKINHYIAVNEAIKSDPGSWVDVCQHQLEFSWRGADGYVHHDFKRVSVKSIKLHQITSDQASATDKDRKGLT